MIRILLLIVVSLIAVITLSTMIGPARGWIKDPSPTGRRRILMFVVVPTCLVVIGFLAIGLFLDPGEPPGSIYVPPTMTDQGIIPGHYETIDE